MTLSRRTFMASSATAGIGMLCSNASRVFAAAPAADRPMLGLDNFSVRGMGWKAAQLIDYAASIDADSLFITDLDAFESFEAPYLAGVKGARAGEARAAPRRHLEHLPHIQGVQAELGHRAGTPRAGHSRCARRGIARDPRRARHVGGSADRRRNRAPYRGDCQSLPRVQIAGNRLRASRSRSRTMPATCIRANSCGSSRLQARTTSA